MKSLYKSALVALSLTMLLSSCKKEGTLDANLDAIDRNIIVNTELDNWLDANFLNPYNIETKYRFDRFELALDRNVTPPLESQVIPAMEMVRDLWIRPYEKVGGANFIKKLSPKQFVLVGSASYNGDGTITLGTAEGGTKVVLYVINSFTKTNVNVVKQMIQTIQHEYAHILNQTVDFQPEFAQVSRGGYVANWTQESLANGRALGFITQYSRSSPGEDFAEMVANMLMMGRVNFNTIVNAQTAEAQAKLRKKESYVVDYYKQAFNIDFYAMQTEVQLELFKIFKPTLAPLIGPLVGYKSILGNPLAQPNQSPEFLNLWTTSRNSLAAAGFDLVNFTMTYTSRTTMTLRYTFTGGTTTYYADADYNMIINAAGVIDFNLIAVQPTTTTYGNMNFVSAYVAGLNAYFGANTFRIDWADNLIPGSPISMPNSLGVFYKVGNEASYFYGTLAQ
jgi:substrate import-associated zinc metallohydrolase lipoprotein